MKKTIKEIDLLVKIANGEIEEGFKVRSPRSGKIYEYKKDADYFRSVEQDNYVYTLGYFTYLNDEVEIIEEDKKIEKLELSRSDGNITIISEENAKIQNKINEIIDCLNELKKGE